MQTRQHSFLKSVSAVAAAIGAIPVRMGVGPFDEFGSPPQDLNLANLDSLRAYGIFTPDDVVAVRQPLYDRMIYDDAGVTGQIRFFQQQLGQGNSSAIGGTGQTKTLDDTNMEVGGQLPTPQAFLVTSIEIMVEPGSISTANAFSPLDTAFLTNASAASVGLVPALNGVNDINRILMGAWLRFDIGSANYLTSSRLDTFPPKSFVAPDAAIAQSVQLGHAGVAAARAVGRPFYVNPPILLMPTVNFVVSLNWGVAVATPTGMNARITVRLDGIQFRRAQ